MDFVTLVFLSFFLYMARFDHNNLFVLCCMHTTWIWWTTDFLFCFVTRRVEESHYNLTLSKVSYKCLSFLFTHDMTYACKVVRTCRYIVLKVEMILPWILTSLCVFIQVVILIWFNFCSTRFCIWLIIARYTLASLRLLFVNLGMFFLEGKLTNIRQNVKFVI